MSRCGHGHECPRSCEQCGLCTECRCMGYDQQCAGHEDEAEEAEDKPKRRRSRKAA